MSISEQKMGIPIRNIKYDINLSYISRKSRLFAHNCVEIYTPVTHYAVLPLKFTILSLSSLLSGTIFSMSVKSFFSIYSNHHIFIFFSMVSVLFNMLDVGKIRKLLEMRMCGNPKYIECINECLKAKKEFKQEFFAGMNFMRFPNLIIVVFLCSW